MFTSTPDRTHPRRRRRMYLSITLTSVNFSECWRQWSYAERTLYWVLSPDHRKTLYCRACSYGTCIWGESDRNNIIIWLNNNHVNTIECIICCTKQKLKTIRCTRLFVFPIRDVTRFQLLTIIIVFVYAIYTWVQSWVDTDVDMETETWINNNINSHDYDVYTCTRFERNCFETDP